VLAATPLLPLQTVTLAEARGRALTRSVRASHALPPFTNSSMDGYAVRAADLEHATSAVPRELPVVEVIAAGRVARRALGPGEAMRIMTGAQIPEGADAVVPFEDCERVELGALERARFTGPVGHHANFRAAGADLDDGAEAIAAGREISPHDLALLASLGVTQLEVRARPRVAIVSTGDELLRVDEPLRPGAIRDSNGPMLEALLVECGCVLARSERVPDRAEQVASSIGAALAAADVVLTVGGISAGDFDPVKQALTEMGSVEQWRVSMKPGRPQAFGVIDGRVLHALPGNPASVACVFEALTRPALRRMQGFSALDRPRLEVRAAERIPSRAGRTDFVRVTLESRDGTWWATPAGDQTSGHVTPQSRAHALLVIPEEASALGAGDRAEALILRWPEAASA
jgi:molybdopterin molybdotransferase